METEQFMRELNVMRGKALKYDNMSTRYVEIAAKLRKLGEELDSISKTIDPFLNIKKVEEGITPRGSFVEVATEIYQKCIEGTEISRKFIEVAYPGYTNEQYGYLLNMVKKMPNISKRREGMFIYLYSKTDTFREKK